jgi:hypothetical protein
MSRQKAACNVSMSASLKRAGTRSAPAHTDEGRMPAAERQGWCAIIPVSLNDTLYLLSVRTENMNDRQLNRYAALAGVLSLRPRSVSTRNSPRGAAFIDANG